MTDHTNIARSCALAREESFPQNQPIVNLATDPICCEALLKEWFLADRTYGCTQPQDEWLGSPSLAADHKGVACSLAQDRQPVHSKADIWDKDIPWDSLDPETLQRILRTLAETTG